MDFSLIGLSVRDKRVYEALINSPEASIRTIAEQTGINRGSVFESLKDLQRVGLVDVKKAGVIDPARVTKEAVQNAVSIASTAATMGALVVDVPEPEAPAMGGGMPGGMGMM